MHDAIPGSWVDTHAPAWSRPYLRLSRADRPIGTWLLLIPCWWGLVLAMLSGRDPGWFDLWIAIGCAGGAWLMRGAGCTWNDITDRHFDAQVARTRSRPIPCGQISVHRAALWMAAQALMAFAILATFPAFAIGLGIAALIPVCIYPFAKRFTWWPQVFLGIAFNWGALLGWAAHSGSLETAPVVLYLAGISWTLFYDTIYAHQDIEDDALIGIKSTARLFAKHTPAWLALFLIATSLLMALAGVFALRGGAAPLWQMMAVCLVSPLAMSGHLAWQLRVLDIHNPENCMRLFRANRDAGLIPLAVMVCTLWI